MKTAGDKKTFIVLGQCGINSTARAFAVKAENLEVACHLAEIKNGWGTFMACDEDQAANIAAEMRKLLAKQ